MENEKPKLTRRFISYKDITAPIGEKHVMATKGGVTIRLTRAMFEKAGYIQDGWVLSDTPPPPAAASVPRRDNKSIYDLPIEQRDYTQMKLHELYILANSRGMTVAKGTRKAELVAMLTECDNCADPAANTCDPPPGGDTGGLTNNACDDETAPEH